MRHTITLSILLNFFYSNAQVSDLISTDVPTGLELVGDYIYFAEYDNEILKRVDISDPSTPVTETLKVLTSGLGSSGPTDISVVGDMVYMPYWGPTGVGSGILQYDLSTPLIDDTVFASGNYLVTEYAPGNIYNVETFAALGTVYKVPLSPPHSNATHATGLTGYVKSLHVNGTSLFIGTTTGDIYFQNLFFGAAPVLKYDGPNLPIDAMFFFEGKLYYAQGDKIYRFNPFSVGAVPELLLDSGDYLTLSAIYSLVIKSYPSGDKYIFVSDAINKIHKIDLNHPTLSSHEVIAQSEISMVNPVHNTLEIKSNVTIDTIEIYSMQGQLIAQHDTRQLVDYNLDASNLASGTYIVRMRHQGQVSSYKLVKE